MVPTEVTDSGVALSKLRSWFAAVTANIGSAPAGAAPSAKAIEAISHVRTARKPNQASIDPSTSTHEPDGADRTVTESAADVKILLAALSGGGRCPIGARDGSAWSAHLRQEHVVSASERG